MLLALAIFGLTYVLISLRRLAHIPLERPAVALLGASLMVLAGVVGPDEALASIDLHTVLLLVGMMLVVVTLEATGLFGRIALWVVAHARTQRQLLVGLGLSTAVLSALVLNDAVVLFFTPIIVHASRLLRVDPLKYLLVEAVTANIGSLATQVGNPQNAYIALASGIPFARYSLIMVPAAALALVAALAVALLLYREELRTPLAKVDLAALQEEGRVAQPRLLAFGLLMVAALFVAFVLSHRLGLPLSLLALAGGSVLVFAAPVLGRASPRVLFRRVDWSILLLFVGLFIVLKGAEASGLMQALFAGLEAISAGSLGTVWGLGLVASVVSNLISNVPATLLLAPLVDAQGREALWLALAASTTLAGNLTLVGAAANLIVAEKAEEMGVAVPFLAFLRLGLPVTLATLAVAFATISVLSRFVLAA